MAKRSERVDTANLLTFETVISEFLPFVNNRFQLEIQLGSATMTIRELLDLEVGSLVELKKSAGEPMEVLCKGRTLMRGEVTVLEDSLGLRIVEIIDPNRRI